MISARVSVVSLLVGMTGVFSSFARCVLIAFCLLAAPPANAEDLGAGAYVVIEPSLNNHLGAETADYFIDVLRYAPDPVGVRGHRIEADSIRLTLRPRDVARALEQLRDHERQSRNDEFVFSYSQAEIEIRSNQASQQRVRFRQRLEEAARIVVPTATVSWRSDTQLVITAPDYTPDTLSTRITESSSVGIHLVLDAAAADADTIVAPAYPGIGQSDEIVLRQPAIGSARFALIGVSADSTGRTAIYFRLDGQGAGELCSFTSDHPDQRFAVIFNGMVLIAPVIVEPICGGAGQIAGVFDQEAAQALASLMRAGVILSQARTVETGDVTAAE